MSEKRSPLGKLIDAATDKLAELMGSLAPRPDAIPIPVRNDPRGPRR